MRINEAFEALGVKKGSSKEEIAKAYKKGLAKNHPDKFKEQADKDAGEKKFKELQEAYNLVKDNPMGLTDGASFSFSFSTNGQGVSQTQGNPVTFSDLASQLRNHMFRRQQEDRAQRANAIVLKISFEESILGCIKKIDIKDKMRCTSCSGRRTAVSDIKCEFCDGGMVDTPDKPAARARCNNCKGTGYKSETCKVCGGIGVESVTKTFQMQLRPGVVTGAEVMLVGGVLNNNRNLVRIHVETDSEMYRSENGEGMDVLSEVEISLKEALQGVTKKVKSVRGEKELKIQPQIKHNQDLRIRGLGVGGAGDHIITIKVNYPDDIDKLIDFLER